MYSSSIVMAAAIVFSSAGASPVTQLEARAGTTSKYGDYSGSTSSYGDGSGTYVRTDDVGTYASGVKCWTDLVRTHRTIRPAFSFLANQLASSTSLPAFRPKTGSRMRIPSTVHLLPSAPAVPLPAPNPAHGGIWLGLSSRNGISSRTSGPSLAHSTPAEVNRFARPPSRQTPATGTT